MSRDNVNMQLFFPHFTDLSHQNELIRQGVVTIISPVELNHLQPGFKMKSLKQLHGSNKIKTF